jgi:hypothetical protein
MMNNIDLACACENSSALHSHQMVAFQVKRGVQKIQKTNHQKDEELLHRLWSPFAGIKTFEEFQQVFETCTRQHVIASNTDNPDSQVFWSKANFFPLK